MRYFDTTKALVDEVHRHKRVAEQLYADVYAMKEIFEAFTNRPAPSTKGMREWEEQHVLQ